MATLNVSLPDPMKQWVEAQSRTGRYRTTSDYVRDLIRRDQERSRSLARLQELITEGMESGVAEDFFMDALQAKLDKTDG